MNPACDDQGSDTDSHSYLGLTKLCGYSIPWHSGGEYLRSLNELKRDRTKQTVLPDAVINSPMSQAHTEPADMIRESRRRKKMLKSSFKDYESAYLDRNVISNPISSTS